VKPWSFFSAATFSAMLVAAPREMFRTSDSGSVGRIRRAKAGGVFALEVREPLRRLHHRLRRLERQERRLRDPNHFVGGEARVLQEGIEDLRVAVLGEDHPLDAVRLRGEEELLDARQAAEAVPDALADGVVVGRPGLLEDLIPGLLGRVAERVGEGGGVSFDVEGEAVGERRDDGRRRGDRAASREPEEELELREDRELLARREPQAARGEVRSRLGLELGLGLELEPAPSRRRV